MSNHLIHALVDMRNLNRWAGGRGLVRHGSFDRDFAFHILLSALFGKGTLQPFRLFGTERQRNATLYAYSSNDAGQLQNLAALVATPDCLEVLGLDTMRSKPMPSIFAKGLRLGFDLRVRPIRRLREDLKNPRSGKTVSKGSEVDVYWLDALRRSPDGWRGLAKDDSGLGRTREAVYGDWLSDRFAGAAEIEDCQLAGLRRTRTVRGDGLGPEGPDARLHGILVVRDCGAFARILRGGVGRHRAYGYGMLLLRPPTMERLRA